MNYFRILIFCLTLFFIIGCESEAQRRSTQSFERILTEKKKFQKIKEDNPSVSEQLMREIYSQSDGSEKKKGTFKFGEK
ncbi:hypothetical protein [Campylobacter sp. RM16190]|uniref:hypothetical protein n=1 Tax=Campylobacter sp. RM16190 TaxID=1705727 RepID=UPI0014753248|nr:hypothetical protein [Campylobacter sp. RM16190]